MHQRNNPDSLDVARLSDLQQARQAEMRMHTRLQRQLEPRNPYSPAARAAFRRKLVLVAAAALLIVLAIAQIAGAAAAASGGGGGGRPFAAM